MLISIPVKPHIKQFVIKLYGPEPVHATARNRFGKLMFLSAEYYHQRSKRVQATPLQDGFTILQVELPKELKHAKFPDYKLYLLADVLERDFREAYMYHASGCLNPQPSEWLAAEQFLELYNIDPELMDQDTLRQIWRRNEERIYNSEGVYNKSA